MRKQTHDRTLLITSKKLDVSIPCVGVLRGHETLVKGGGTHDPRHYKFKYDMYGGKGHVHQDCTLEVEVCHRCYQHVHIRENCPSLSIRAAHTPSSMVF